MRKGTGHHAAHRRAGRRNASLKDGGPGHAHASPYRSRIRRSLPPSEGHLTEDPVTTEIPTAPFARSLRPAVIKEPWTKFSARTARMTRTRFPARAGHPRVDPAPRVRPRHRPGPPVPDRRIVPRHAAVACTPRQIHQLWDISRREISTCPNAVGKSPVLVFDCT